MTTEDHSTNNMHSFHSGSYSLLESRLVAAKGFVPSCMWSPSNAGQDRHLVHRIASQSVKPTNNNNKITNALSRRCGLCQVCYPSLTFNASPPPPRPPPLPPSTCQCVCFHLLQGSTALSGVLCGQQTVKLKPLKCKIAT